jgi:MFS family permease
MAVAGAFLIHMTLGTIFTFGNMNPYVMSCIRRKNENVTYADSIWIYAMAITGQSFCMCFGGLIEFYLGTSMTVWIGGWIMSIGMITTFYAITTGLIMTIFTYGLVFGCGVGIAYSVALSAATSWYPSNQGLVTGIVLAGYGGGAFIFTFAQTAFINPLAMKPDRIENDEMFFTQSYVLDRVPYCFMLLGGIYAILQVIAALLISKAPSDFIEERTAILAGGQKSTKKVAAKSEALQSAKGAKEDNNKSPKEMLQTCDFWIMWITFLFNSVCLGLVTTMYKAFGALVVSDDYFLAVVGSLGATFNALSRVAWGHLHDIVRYKKLIFFQTFFMGLLLITFKFTQGMGKWLYLLWVCLLFAIISGTSVLFPASTLAIFGQKYLSINYGILYSANAVANIATATLLHFLKIHWDWFGTFAFGTVCAACGFVCTCFFQGPFTSTKTIK